MFRKPIIIRILVLLLAIGIFISLSWAGLKIKESQETEEFKPTLLSPDKFVFIEVFTDHKEEILGKHISENGGDYYNKNHKKLSVFPQIKPLFAHIEIPNTNFIVNKGSEIEKALLVINTFFTGKTIALGIGFGSSGEGSFHTIVKSLPFRITDVWKKEREERNEFILAHKDIYFTGVNKEGEVKIRYGEEEIVLKPGNSWDKTEKIIEKFENEKKKKLRVKATTKVTIKNRGIINKIWAEKDSLEIKNR